MSKCDRNRTLALAGVFQAAQLVQRLAHHGQADPGALASSTQSILKTHTDSTDDVFGGVGGVFLGLKILSEKLGGRSESTDMELARYVIAAIQLSGKIKRQPKLMESIRNGLDNVQSQMKFFGNNEDDGKIHPRLTTKLAELYLKNISTLKPRVMVSGEQSHLGNNLVAEKVRVALFAAIRAAYLWRQLGGNRWQLIFGRIHIVRSASEILQSLSENR